MIKNLCLLIFTLFFNFSFYLIGQDIDSAKATCKDIGFKIGTEKFGECVLLLIQKEEKNNSSNVISDGKLRCNTTTGDRIGPIIAKDRILTTCQQAVTICWPRGEQAYWAAKNGNNTRVNEIVGQMKENDPYTAIPEITRLFGTIMSDNRAQELGKNVLNGCLARYGYGKL